MKGTKLSNLEEKLYQYEGEDQMVSSHDLAEQLKATEDSVFSFKSGIPTMDRLLDGLEAGELVVVSGPSGHGKTTFLMTITQNIDVRSAWFSLEVTARQFLKKLSVGGELPYFFLPAKNVDNNVQWLIERIIEAKVKYDIQAVFIDHLHQIFSIDRFHGKNLSLELGDIVARIKQLAIDLNITIFLIAHSTDAKDSTNREPQMRDVRDSGMIIRLADTVMGIWRIKNSNDGSKSFMEDIEEDDTRAKLRIWKNRREGKTGHVVLDFRDGKYMELSKEYLETTNNKKGYDEKIPGWD